MTKAFDSLKELQRNIQNNYPNIKLYPEKISKLPKSKMYLRQICLKANKLNKSNKRNEKKLKIIDAKREIHQTAKDMEDNIEKIIKEEQHIGVYILMYIYIYIYIYISLG